jgi:hypothetical protein
MVRGASPPVYPEIRGPFGPQCENASEDPSLSVRRHSNSSPDYGRHVQYALSATRNAWEVEAEYYLVQVVCESAAT